MNKTRGSIWLGILVALALACALPGLGGGAANTNGSGSNAQFEENFSDNDNGWDEFTTDTSEVGFQGEEYVFKIFAVDRFVWANPEGTRPASDNVRIEVTTRSTGAAADSGFGLICNYLDRDNYYYMGVSVDGYYTIVKTIAGADTVLTGEGWIPSDSVPVNASEYRVRADCANGSQTLYLGDTQLASASDSELTGGTIGLFVHSFAEENAEIHFDNLVVTALE